MAHEIDQAGAGDERLRAAIGPRAHYYLDRWRRMDATGKRRSWNWAACFANLYWLAYRKMWLALALFVLANVVVSFAGALIPPNFVFVLAIGLTFVTGDYGNLLYRRQIDRLMASGASEAELRVRGGTSRLALGIALALSLGAAALVGIGAMQQIQAQRAAGLRSH